MAHLDAHLFFDGNCAEAMRFYARVFGGEPDMMQTYGESPAAGDVPPDKHGRAQMPLRKTFRAAAFGMLVDRFGTPWMVNVNEPAGGVDADQRVRDDSSGPGRR